MKTSLATCACALLLVASLWAIPQTFGPTTNLFFQNVGVNFEQFASDPAAWDGTALKGHWETHGDSLTLTDSAAVFGVAADEVTAQQKDGQVQSFRVVYREKSKQKRKAGNLFGQVTANVKAFTGVGGTGESSGFIQYSFKNVLIKVTGTGGDVVVEFKRA